MFLGIHCNAGTSKSWMCCTVVVWGAAAGRELRCERGRRASLSVTAAPKMQGTLQD